MTHLNRFSKQQRDAVEVLRIAIRNFNVTPFEQVVVSDPHAVASALRDARATVEADEALRRECARQLYTQFNMADPNPIRRAEVLETYHDEVKLLGWLNVALNWVSRLADSLEARPVVRLQ